MSMKGNILLLFIIIVLFACKQQDQSASQVNTTGNTAIDKISQALDKDPQNANLFYERGQMFYEKELYDEAIADLNSAIQIDSLQADFHHLLSNAYMDYFKSRKALSVMENAALLFPDRIPTLLKLSETQMILQSFEDMNLTLRRIISKDPQNAEAYFMMGMMFREQNDLEKAKNAFQAAIELDPELIDGWIILGNIYEVENDPLALQYYTSASEIDTSSVQALHAIAYYQQNHENIDEALNTYRRINLLDRNYPDAYLNAGILYLEKENFEAAKEQFNLLIGINPKFYLGYYYRGIVHELMDDPQNAIADYQTCSNFNPQFEKATEALKVLKTKQSE